MRPPGRPFLLNYKCSKMVDKVINKGYTVMFENGNEGYKRTMVDENGEQLTNPASAEQRKPQRPRSDISC